MDPASDHSAEAARENDVCGWDLDQMSSFLQSPSPPMSLSPFPGNVDDYSISPLAMSYPPENTHATWTVGLHSEQSNLLGDELPHLHQQHPLGLEDLQDQPGGVEDNDASSHAGAVLVVEQKGTSATDVTPSPRLPSPLLSTAFDNSLLSGCDNSLLPLEHHAHWLTKPMHLCEASPHSWMALNNESFQRRQTDTTGGGWEGTEPLPFYRQIEQVMLITGPAEVNHAPGARVGSTISLTRDQDQVKEQPPQGTTSQGYASPTQALQIREIAENPMPSTETESENELIETDNRNCATAALMDTQGTKAVAPSHQHQLPMDLGYDDPFILKSEEAIRLKFLTYTPCKRASWSDLVARTWYDSGRSGEFKSVKVTMEVIADPFKGSAEIIVATSNCSHKYLFSNRSNSMSVPEPKYAWANIRQNLCMLGFGKLFAGRSLRAVINLLAEHARFDLSLTMTHPSNGTPRLRRRIEDVSEQGNKDNINNIEPGDVARGKWPRLIVNKRAKVWNHFTEVVDAEGHSVGKAKCKHCGKEYRTDSARNGTSSIRNHIMKTHSELAGSL